MEKPPMLSLSEGDVTRAEEKSCKGHSLSAVDAARLYGHLANTLQIYKI